MTSEQRHVAKQYITYRVFTSMWFVSAVWLYFYRLFITDEQVGILDGLAFAIGLVAEVPSGVLADKFGRAKIASLGQILAGGGLLIQAFGSSFLPFFVGQAIMMIGISLLSGADEAFFFQKLNFDKKSTHWRKLVTRSSQIALVASFFAIIIGGWFHTVNPRLPWVANGVAFIGASVIILRLRDDQPKKSRQKFLPELKSYMKDIRVGFLQFRLPKLWLYVPFIITVQGLFYTTGYGLLRLILLDRFWFDPFWGSVVIGSSSLVTIILLGYLHKHADSLSEKKMLVIIGLIAAASLLLSIANIGWWGYFVILALYAGEHILHPFMSEVLNNKAPEAQRATVLSVASFFKTLPYIVLAPIIGYLSTNGKIEYFFVVWAVLIIGALVLYVLARKRDTRIDLLN